MGRKMRSYASLLMMTLSPPLTSHLRIRHKKGVWQLSSRIRKGLPLAFSTEFYVLPILLAQTLLVNKIVL